MRQIRFLRKYSSSIDPVLLKTEWSLISQHKLLASQNNINQLSVPDIKETLQKLKAENSKNIETLSIQQSQLSSLVANQINNTLTRVHDHFTVNVLSKKLDGYASKVNKEILSHFQGSMNSWITWIWSCSGAGVADEVKQIFDGAGTKDIENAIFYSVGKANESQQNILSLLQNLLQSYFPIEYDRALPSSTLVSKYNDIQMQIQQWVSKDEGIDPQVLEFQVRKFNSGIGNTDRYVDTYAKNADGAIRFMGSSFLSLTAIGVAATYLGTPMIISIPLVITSQSLLAYFTKLRIKNYQNRLSRSFIDGNKALKSELLSTYENEFRSSFVVGDFCKKIQDAIDAEKKELEEIFEEIRKLERRADDLVKKEES